MKWLIRIFIIVLAAAVISNSLIHCYGVFETHMNTANTTANTNVILFINKLTGKVLGNHLGLITTLFKRVGRLEVTTDFERLMNATVVIYDISKISGTGVCIGQDEKYYYVISAQHTVRSHPENNIISVRLRNNIMVAGEIIKEDVVNDLSLIRLTKQTSVYLEVVKIVETNLKFGDTVYAVGHPLTYEYLLTKGIVSNTKHPKFIISNIVVAYGSSGGGLFNVNGELAGINVRASHYRLVLSIDENGDEFKVSAPLFALSASVKTDIIKEFLSGE